MLSINNGKAEYDFRMAFERLKNNKPEILPPNSSVTQNNVAREAGRDPSALKKNRYPFLIAEIQAYKKSEVESTPVIKKLHDNRSRTEKQKLASCRKQIDKLSSIVAAQNSYIESLLDEIEILKTGKILAKDNIK